MSEQNAGQANIKVSKKRNDVDVKDVVYYVKQELFDKKEPFKFPFHFGIGNIYHVAEYNLFWLNSMASSLHR